MMSNKPISTFQLIFKGYLWVNIPVIAIIIFSWLALISFTNLGMTICILLAGAAGWIYWEYTIPLWVKWGLQNNVDEKKLLWVGQLSLLLWNDSQIKE